jgi:hypothetical protein
MEDKKALSFTIVAKIDSQEFPLIACPTEI